MVIPVHFIEDTHSLELLFGDRRLSMHKGDVTNLTAEALVCPVDQNLDFRSGVARIISQAAGPAVRGHRPETHETFGKLVVLPGGHLKVKYIFLAVVLGDKDEDRTKLHIRRAVDRAIKYAEFLRLKSIAFPVLGSPRTKFPYGFIAKEMLESVANYFRRRNTKLKVALFSIYNSDAFEAFRRESRNIAAL